MLDYNIYLKQIKEMIARIEKTTRGHNKDSFVRDINLFDSTILRLQVIGESIKSIPLNVKKANKQVRWRFYSNLRNFISHKYIEVNPNIIWDVVVNKLSELKEQINSVK